MGFFFFLLSFWKKIAFIPFFSIKKVHYRSKCFCTKMFKLQQIPGICFKVAPIWVDGNMPQPSLYPFMFALFGVLIVL